MTRSSTLLGAAALWALLCGGSGALAAGQVQLQWIEPQHFADAGRGAFERERNLTALADHLQGLARQLPEGWRLQVAVTDLELAGTLEHLGPWHDEVRVMRGRADWPRISLRYTLSDGARVQAQGDAVLSDPNYLQRSSLFPHQGALAHEKRLLDDWVASLLAPSRAARR